MTTCNGLHESWKGDVDGMRELSRRVQWSRRRGQGTQWTAPIIGAEKVAFELQRRDRARRSSGLGRRVWRQNEGEWQKGAIQTATGTA